MTDPDMAVWTGRIDAADGPLALRWHQRVTPLTHGCPPGVALVGFACDEGVRRNGGRVGAKDGPRAIRAALANLAWHQDHPVYDVGDVFCDGENLEAAQVTLGEVVASLIVAGHRPLVLGGGHETAWGTFQGVATADPAAPVGVVNLDAHFDLRGDEQPNSGTPFAQIARWCQARYRPFQYACLGVAEPANTAALFAKADDLGVLYLRDDALSPDALPHVRAVLEDFCVASGRLHLSLDLDVLPAATMPAVSAPAAGGVSQAVVEALLVRILQAGLVRAVDVVEFNPSLDPDGRGARVAARLVWLIATVWKS